MGISNPNPTRIINLLVTMDGLPTRIHEKPVARPPPRRFLDSAPLIPKFAKEPCHDILRTSESVHWLVCECLQLCARRLAKIAQRIDARAGLDEVIEVTNCLVGSEVATLPPPHIGLLRSHQNNS